VRLTEAQSRALLAKHGVRVTEACDQCGQILGPVRFTRYGEPGEWCSRECRDGLEAAERYRDTRRHVAEHAAPTLDSKQSLRSRKGGRPLKYRTDRERRTAERQQHAMRQQAYRKRRSVTENPLVSNSFHVSTEGENRPLAIPIAEGRV
jgi:hypothetical protein